MKLSFDWLSDFVDLEGITPQVLAERLTMGAFEVEEVTVFGADLIGPIVVGEIVEIHPHPNADKIRLTKTRIKDGEDPLEIVCGAQNIEVGQRVPVALPGAKVVNRKDGSALLIKASAIRGVHSNGMLCSPPELGMDLGEGAGEGILILNGNGKAPALGQDIQDLLGLKPDYILHVEPRSNRGDALSVQGLAREVAALFNRPLKTPPWSLSELTSPAPASQTIKIWRQEDRQTSNQADCPFFSMQEISDVKIGPAPAFISRRLEAIGLRPVNNVVDITNYVMHELGQPLHAYDKAKIKHTAVGVRRAREEDGEKITTLDGRERTLTGEMLVIVDAPALDSRAPEARIIGVAGIMGGQDSEVTDATTTLLLEAACFGQAVVRRGSRLLGLSSDASLRFERGVDVASVLNAGQRAAYLIAKHCTESGAQAVTLSTSGTSEVAPSKLTLRMPQIKRILGIEIPAAQVKSLLTPLGFVVSEGRADAKDGAETLDVSVPSFRQADVTREIDLIEEVCRLNGYDKIPAIMPSATFAREAPADSLQLLRTSLSAQGLSEAWLSSLVPGDSPGLSASKLVSVLNPLSKDHQALRQSLIPGLLQAAAYNQNHGAKNVWLYESGRVYLREGQADGEGSEGGKTSTDKNKAGKRSEGDNGQSASNGTGVRENLRLAGIICGEKARLQNVDYYTAKGLVENIFESLGIESRRYQFFSPENQVVEKELPWLHPFRSAVVALNRPAKKGGEQANQSLWDNAIVLGYVGQLHPKTKDQLGLRQDAFVFELDLQKIAGERKAKKFGEIATSQSVVRDITADFDKSKRQPTHQEIVSLVTKKAGANIKQTELISVFQSDKEASNVALTYRLTFQHATENLSGEEIDKVMAQVRESLSSELGASFRL
ncbi:MAG: phenylalanine--tRNA ligase subunit beta [Cyanobacteria bacterium REEB67]|nr:phenylalanine--tRNA ligase subunit beta [Cyanobacteria bacterium REEB67]